MQGGRAFGWLVMALAETPDALSVVNQLRDLASEPQNRDVIVRDHGCLPGLVLFLDHVDNAVVFSALQVHLIVLVTSLIPPMHSSSALLSFRLVL